MSAIGQESAYISLVVFQSNEFPRADHLPNNIRGETNKEDCVNFSAI